MLLDKVDRPNSRPDDVVNEVFDLLVQLEADDKALDFSIVYASAKEGWATADLSKKTNNLKVIFDTIIKKVPALK